jgi:hypothetical protein
VPTLPRLIRRDIARTSSGAPEVEALILPQIVGRVLQYYVGGILIVTTLDQCRDLVMIRLMSRTELISFFSMASFRGSYEW